MCFNQVSFGWQIPIFVCTQMQNSSLYPNILNPPYILAPTGISQAPHVHGAHRVPAMEAIEKAAQRMR